MALHPLAAQFASVAAVYERGRPEYAPAVVGALATELQPAPGAPVLDLAAGTGKLTRALLATGFDVTAVEPQVSLRELLAANVGAERTRDGLAESIPLADASVEVVTVADAFHWFDSAPRWSRSVACCVPAVPEGRRAETLARVAALVESGETPEELTVQVVVGLGSLA